MVVGSVEQGVVVESVEEKTTGDSLEQWVVWIDCIVSGAVNCVARALCVYALCLGHFVYVLCAGHFVLGSVWSRALCVGQSPVNCV